MKQFEIQELAHQDANGVTFRALDKTTNQIVSLRRFFPFGIGDGEDEEIIEGLDPHESKAFSSACERLSKIKHAALRNTIYGNTDPVDGMPYLVTEWINGDTLADALGGKTMDPALIIGLLRQALDVCSVLSQTLDSEAIWIDTKPESIIVSDLNETPKFSFRICPFKWLGTQSHHKDMTGIISLVETLMNWKSKLVSDQAGLGLGGWLKLLRHNPNMSIADALETLPNPEAPSTTEPPLIKPSMDTWSSVQVNPNPPTFNNKSLIVVVVSTCVIAGISFLVYLNFKSNNHTRIGITNTEIVPSTQPSNSNPASTSKETINQQNKPQSVDNLIKPEEKLTQPEDELTQPEDNIAKNEDITDRAQAMLDQRKIDNPTSNKDPQEVARTDRGKDDEDEIVELKPDDWEEIQKMKLRVRVKVTGVIKSVKIPTGQKNLYFDFSDPFETNQIRVFTNPGGFSKGTHKKNFSEIEATYQNLVGSTVTFSGTTTRSSSMNNQTLVFIDEPEDIQMHDK